MIFSRNLAVIAIVVFASTAWSGDKALQSACFAAEALKSMPGERVPVRARSKPVISQTAAQLHAYAPVSAGLRGSIRRVDIPDGRKVIAMTFDLCETRGETAGYDGEITDYLREHGIKATFFAGGQWMRSHEGRTQQLMSDPLFEMANHGDTHRNVRKLEAKDLGEEILGPQRSYETIRSALSEAQCTKSVPDAMTSVPSRISLYRFPFGACNRVAMEAVNDAGLLAIQWDVSVGDSSPATGAMSIASRILKAAKPGSIVIAHANGRGWHTAAALKIVIPKLKAAGYEFATVSELLAMGKPVIAETCYDSRPGDTDRYDNLFALRPPASTTTPGRLEPAPVSPPAVTTSAKKKPADDNWNPNAEPFAGR